MDRYMSQQDKKVNVQNILGNIKYEDLIGENGVSKNGLIGLVENILQEIMGKEKKEFLNGSISDKSNGSYSRTLNTSLGVKSHRIVLI